MEITLISKIISVVEKLFFFGLVVYFSIYLYRKG